MSMQDFDVAVVGKGLMGSAAARYLSRDGARVALVGPDEPSQPLRHQGVFASHYDQGRLTRLIGRDPIYSKLAEYAIAAYEPLEEASGVTFHHPVGSLVVDEPGMPAGHMKDPLGVAHKLGRRHTLYPSGNRGWRSVAPHYEFPERYRVIHEPPPAGYINPREMLRAQIGVAEANGAKIIRETVLRIATDKAGALLELTEGPPIRARDVVVAAGAFTGFHELLPRPLPFRTETETIALGRVSEADGERLGREPTVVYLVEDPEISDLYMTPPIRYPDGEYYVKAGANTIYDTSPETLEEVGRWFRNGDSDRARDAFARALRAIWPGVSFLGFETRRCILSRTPSGYPVIDRVDDHLVVAAGGNGGSAKSADTLGRLAAGLVTDEPWLDGIPRDAFRANVP